MTPALRVNHGTALIMFDNGENLPHKVATVRREGTGEYLEIVEFPLVGGGTARRAFPRELFGSVRELRGRLLRGGAAGPLSEYACKRLIAEKAPVTGTLATTTGWHDDHATFVFSHCII